MNPVDLMVEGINEELLKVTFVYSVSALICSERLRRPCPWFSQIEPAPSQFVS